MWQLTEGLPCFDLSAKKLGAARLNRTSRANLLLNFILSKFMTMWPWIIYLTWIEPWNILEWGHAGKTIPLWFPEILNIVLISFCSTWVWQLSPLVIFTSDFNSLLLPLGINYANNYVQTFLPLEGRLEAAFFSPLPSPHSLHGHLFHRSPFSPSRMTRTPSYAG